MADVVKLSDLKKEDVPEELLADTYFDFSAHPFAHSSLFEKTSNVVAAVVGIHDYAVEWLGSEIEKGIKGGTSVSEKAPADCMATGKFRIAVEDGAVFMPTHIVGSADGDVNTIYVCKGASVIGVSIYLADGSIFVGENTVVEPGVGLKGPTIIGADCEVRQGVYFRGDIITGDGGTFRGEIKNAVMMDKANFPHPSYVGDSLCGYFTHFGNQATSANLGIFNGMKSKNERKNLTLTTSDGLTIDIGQAKLGVIMGDFSQVGCSSVIDPGTFLKPYTISYPLTRFTKGVYGPNEILKYKPMEHGIVERVSLKK